VRTNNNNKDSKKYIKMIDEEIFKQIRCCLSTDDHIVEDPMLLECEGNACKKCLDELTSSFSCLYCKIDHSKDELNKMRIVKNKTAEFLIKISLNSLVNDVNGKLQILISQLQG
jgi:hypothetical protein